MQSVSPLWRALSGLPSPDRATADPIAAVLVPLYEDVAGTVRVVITKRPDHMPTHAGQLAFPGGRVDPTDPDPIAAALREAEEEVGIRPADVTVLGVLPTITTNRLDMVVLPVVGRVAGVPHLVPEPGEVDLILEPPLEIFLDEDGWRSELWADHRLWFFEIEGEILWGASAWIMRLLLDVLRGRRPG